MMAQPTKTTTLMNNLYTIVSREDNNGTPTFRIHLNAESPIYADHFPGKPITPGACIIQTALELTEKITGHTMEIREIKNVKFLHVLSPTENPDMEFYFKSLETTANGTRAKIEVRNSSATFTTISILCK